MKHLIAAALLFSGSLFAQENHTSDTLFLTFKTHRNNEYQQILNMPGEFYDMGLVNGVLYEFKKKNKMIEDEIKATRVVSSAVPNRQDLEAAYKASFKSGADGTVSFEDFLKKGVDAGDIRKIKNSAEAMAVARQKAQDKAKTPAQRSAVQKSRLQTGESMGSSVRPGSSQGEVDAGESNRDAVDSVMDEMLRKMGYKR